MRHSLRVLGHALRIYKLVVFARLDLSHPRFRRVTSVEWVRNGDDPRRPITGASLRVPGRQYVLFLPWIGVRP